MNVNFAYHHLNDGEVVRITTSDAVGIIGKIENIDPANDGLILAGIQDEELLEQIEGSIEYEKVLIPITDIKYIFKLNLKSKKEHGLNDS